jgi:hypothetical protein
VLESAPPLVGAAAGAGVAAATLTADRSGPAGSAGARRWPAETEMLSLPPPKPPVGQSRIACAETISMKATIATTINVVAKTAPVM